MAKKKAQWNAGGVKALRHHMELTQTELAEILGVRQQTISEWETGAYEPRGASGTLLGRVADDAGYVYDSSPRPPAKKPRRST